MSSICLIYLPIFVAIASVDVNPVDHNRYAQESLNHNRLETGGTNAFKYMHNAIQNM